MLARLRIDPYVLVLLAMVGVASVFPARGDAATVVSYAANASIVVLFFLYGGRLAREVIVAGMAHWRLQGLVFLSTYLLFPVLGLACRFALGQWLARPLLDGIVFLGLLPSTVQSSIAFTSIARGNVPAAICSAAVSNLAGVVLTPLLVALVLGKSGATSGSPLDGVWKIVGFLLLPFVVGHALRPWIGGLLERNKHWLSYVDRGSILLVVYTAFSEGVVNGIWRQVPPLSIITLLAVCAVLLGAVLALTAWTSRALGFSKEDEIAIVFCGSKKSLASGLPMAKILFAGPSVGLVVLPLMLFHQIQLMVCAALARRYGARTNG